MIQFFRRLGLTKRDLILISFLLISLITGLILKSAGWRNHKTFDYSGTDAAFENQVKSAYDKYNFSAEEQGKVNRLKELNDSLLDEKENSTPLKTGEIPLKKININLALSSDLQLLPGVGEVTAERIIEYRESHDGFKSTGELMQVKGIGSKKFDKLKNLVTIN